MVDHEQRRRRSRLRQLADAFRIQNPPSLLARERLAAASGSDPNNESSSNNSSNNNNNSSNRGGRRNNNNRDQTISEFRVAARRAAGAEQHQHQQQQQQRRRLPRGWWPDQNKRAGLKLKAMDDLKDETFVITEEHIEYVFKEEHDDFNENNNTADDDPTISASEQQAEYEINLILPNHRSCAHQPSKKQQQLECNDDTTTDNNSNNNHSSNCAICMIDYDIGDVVIYSKHCSHVFHQDCILNWFSHSNMNCPTCRSCFWVKKKKRNTMMESSSSSSSNSAGGSIEGGNNGDEGEGMMNNNRRPRSDTADTEILGGEIGRGDSVDVDVAISSENYTLSPVAEV